MGVTRSEQFLPSATLSFTQGHFGCTDCITEACEQHNQGGMHKQTLMFRIGTIKVTLSGDMQAGTKVIYKVTSEHWHSVL